MYKRIDSYGVIGDLRTTALIGQDGSLDWLCLPFLDSPSVFAALLDDRQGGRFLLQPTEPFDSSSDYLPRTNVLVTRFRTRSGVLRLTDFMPLGFTQDEAEDQQGASRQAVYRLLEVEHGWVEVRAIFQPRFDYARTETRLEAISDGVLASGGGKSLALTCSRSLEIGQDRAEAIWDLEVPDRVWLRLGSTESGQCSLKDKACEDVADSDRALQETADFWRAWLNRSETGRSADPGMYRDMVERSALVLKLLFFQPSGAMAAAPTTSLPESIGGSRNWDYRFTWIRDTAFTLKALFKLGHLSETESYLRWIEGILSGHSTGKLRIMYGLRGEEELPETELNHLDGYKGSRPVRIGNEAASQVQMDIYGELMDAVLQLSDYVGKIDAEKWPVLRAICDYVCSAWHQPDYGIWEVRGGPRHFVYSKVMCWVALDRGLTIARRYGFPADNDRWERTRSAIKAEVLEQGFSSSKQAFVQHYGTEELDASTLLIPLLGFLPPDDHRVVSTVEAVIRELGQGDFIYRYRAEDGLQGSEGTFLLCSFWLIDCLIAMGRLQEAEKRLRSAERAASRLGLFAEEYDVSWRESLGNFPQAFTHIGYINSVLNLNEAKSKQRDGGQPADQGLPSGKSSLAKRLLAGAIRLNDGQVDQNVPAGELAGRLKTNMNLLRGAFFQSEQGRVAYEQMKNSDLYEEYLDLSRNLKHFDPGRLNNEAEAAAFWINLYNVIVIHGVIELNIRDSVKEVRNFFQRIRYDIGGLEFTPDDIEHGILRANSRPPFSLFKPFGRKDPRLKLALNRLDPRIHFALVCASSSCPPIEIYTAQGLDSELTVSARTFLNAGGIGIDRAQSLVRLSRIFLWYAEDFGADMASRLRFLSQFLYDEQDRAFVQEQAPRLRVEYIPYDWRLNRG